MDAMANVAARGASLTEQLLDQWKFAEVEPEIAAVGQRIITYIDSDGLLGADLPTILDQNRTIPGVAPEQLTLDLFERALEGGADQSGAAGHRRARQSRVFPDPDRCA